MEHSQENTVHAIYIASLIHRLREKGALTEAERSDLAAWRSADEQNEQLFQQLNDRTYLLAQLGKIDNAAFETTILRLFNRLEGIPRGRTRRLPVYRNWLSAAAVLLLLLAGTWYFLLNKKPSPAVSPATPILKLQADISPGGNKAVLTLAGGARILLDTAQDGQLARQGRVNILKTGNGQLAYKPSGADANEMVYNMLTTPRGGQYQLKLPDGTLVWLDAASSIRYPVAFAGHERVVAVTGQAYFEVARNPAMPFIVQDDKVRIEVLGTTFNINTYQEDGPPRITLLEGTVKVKRDNSVVLLKPGQQAVVQLQQIRVIDNADLEGVVAWKNGLFKFDNSDITAIMREAARWYDLDVTYEGQPSDERFKGKVLRNSKLSGFLKILELNNIHFSVEGKKVTVLQKNP